MTQPGADMGERVSLSVIWRHADMVCMAYIRFHDSVFVWLSASAARKQLMDGDVEEAAKFGVS